jgi:cell division protein FtsN
MVNGMKIRISCGPQAAPHVTTVRRGEAPSPGKNVHYNKNSWEGSNLSLPPETRIVPDHVYKNRDTQVAHVPAGYRPAWEDDRLNPYRAYQTVQGFADTQKVWTNTVPRELVTQVRRHEVKAPIIVGRDTAPLPLTAYVATKSGIVASTDPSAKVGRWIEIGAFTTAEMARHAASRLHAAGLTVRMGQHQKNGQTLALLRVGPYGSFDALQAALHQVRGTGYTQAYIR